MPPFRFLCIGVHHLQLPVTADITLLRGCHLCCLKAPVLRAALQAAARGT